MVYFIIRLCKQFNRTPPPHFFVFKAVLGLKVNKRWKKKENGKKKRTGNRILLSFGSNRNKKENIKRKKIIN